MEEMWRTYYANIFNPARVKVHAMQAEMPKKYWRNLPEATLIPTLLREAPRRVETMMKKSAAKICEVDGDEWRPAPVPETSSLTKLREAAARLHRLSALQETRRRPFSAKARNARRSCSSANSRATRKT